MQYDPNNPPGKQEWLSLPESERTDLVLDYHRDEKIELPNEILHAAIHVTVENQIALGDALPVEAKLNQLIEEGLNRHDAVHAIGSVFTEQIFDIVSHNSETDDPNVAYFDALKSLTAQAWIEKYSDI